MNEELQKYQEKPPSDAPTGLATFDPTTQVSDLEGFEDAVVTPATMVMVQATTRDEEAHPGTFKDTITGQEYTTLQIVPLRIQTSPGPRVLFPNDPDTGKTIFGADPICRSNDGYRPAVNAAQPQSELCKNCKYGDLMWKVFAKTRKPPECKEKARVLFVERTTGLPFIITFGGRSVTPVKTLLKAIMRLAQKSLSDGIKTGIYDFTTEMTLKKITDAKGTYYVVLFKNPMRVRNIGEFGPLYQELVKSRDALANAPEVGAEEDTVIDAQPVTEGSQPAVPTAQSEIVDEDVPF